MIEKIVAKWASNKLLQSLAFAVSSPRDGIDLQAGAGRIAGADGRPMTTDSPYFIASATKLYTTAITMQLRAESRLDLDAPAHAYLPRERLAGIHVWGGVDHSGSITVRQLLAHTSGLADYFEQKQSNGTTLIDQIVKERDRGWSLDDVLEINRTRLKPKFIPGTPGRAFYSDTNYQLLGGIIEAVTGLTFDENLRARVIEPLGLTRTYLFTRDRVKDYALVATMYDGARPLVIPQAMASFGADGGMVSTANEGIVFLKAFMQGKLFPQEYLSEMTHWNKIFFPLEYGVGIMRFKLPWFFSPFRAYPELVGHSGASGTVLFYCAKLDRYISGTINQIQKRHLPYKLMLQLVTTHN
jgi:D-alanyl-D-alanine carboxypeptidase